MANNHLVVESLETLIKAVQTYVAAIFYDADHTPIGISNTVIMEDLNPNDTIGFELSGITLPEGVNTDTVADYEIFAYPAQFQ